MAASAFIQSAAAASIRNAAAARKSARLQGMEPAGDPQQRDDERFMRIAIEQARAALECGEVPVGCAFVREGTVLGTGHNETNATMNATRHAELVAIDRILTTHDASALRGCTLYVTIEPCVMCAAALALVYVGRVVFGGHNEHFGGCGSCVDLSAPIALPAPHVGYSCTPGVLKEDAIGVLREFYSRSNPRVPNSRKRRRRTASHEQGLLES